MNQRHRKATTVLLLIVGWASVAAAVEPLEESWPAEDVKSAARRILKDPEFRHFDHFPTDVKAIPVQPPTVAGDADPNPATEAGDQRAPWWKQARDNQQGQGGKTERGHAGQNGAGGSNSSGKGEPGAGQPAQGASGQGKPAQGQPGQDQAGQGQTGQGQPGRSTNPATKPNPANDGTVRPTRITPTGPSARGQDGIERPVRQSLRKSAAPKPDSSSQSDSSMRIPSLGIGSALGVVFHGLAYLLLAAIVVVILYLIAIALISAWGERAPTASTTATLVAGPLADDRSPGETAADEYLRAALALAQQGNFHAAVGQLLLGGMSFIERQQWIRYRRGLTNRDYLRVLRSRPEQAAGFRTVVQTFEPLEYGRRPATEAHYQQALAGYRRGFTPADADAESPE